MKYRFEITYTPKVMQDVVELMRKMDLDFEGIGLKHVMTFYSKRTLSISEIKQKITQAYESDQCKILDIQGGTVE